jgi:3-oxoacyl-[acyl-carrier protein] reductase
MNNSNLLQDMNAVITGANRGIGREVVKLFAQHGANIWACARSENEEYENFLSECSEVHNVEIFPVYFDLSDKDQIRAGIKEIMSTRRPVDICVNNAGITYNALFQMSTLEKMHEVFEVNFFSQMLISQYIVKLMLRQKRGSIINISSTAGLDGNSGRSIYGASKAAIICASKAMAEELGESGIRVNSIAPGITQTDMLTSMSDEMIDLTSQETHLKRVGNPSEIAGACLFLASPLAEYITGQVIRVDGGLG